MRNRSFRLVLRWCVLLLLCLLPAGSLAALTYDNDGNVTLQWQPNSEPDLAGYNVHRAGQSGGPYTKVNATLVVTATFTDTTAIEGATHYYVVTAVDQVGNESGYSPESDGCRVDSAAPTIWASPSGGYYYGTLTVELHASEQAVIRYTTDGTIPSASSPVSFRWGSSRMKSASSAVVSKRSARSLTASPSAWRAAASETASRHLWSLRGVRIMRHLLSPGF